MKDNKIKEFSSKVYKNYLDNYAKSLKGEEKQRAIGYIYIILSMITVSFFGIFAIKPTLETISNLNRQYEDNLVVYEGLEKKLDALTKLENQYQSLQSDLGLIYLAIPKSSKIPYLTRQIETLVKEKGLSLTQLSYTTTELYPATKESPSIYSFTFNVKVEGDPVNANSIIDDIINFDRTISLKSVNTGKTKDEIYSVSILGEAYFSDQKND